METIDEDELIGGAIEAFARELRVALPGRIQSYDAQKQRASIELQLSYYVPTTDGGQLARKHTVLQNVPICFPQGGGYFCAFPMAKGDPVTVVFNDVPLGAWLAKGQTCEPGVDDMHGLGGAVAFPAGPQPSNTPLQSAGGSNMVLGKDGGDDAQIELTPTEVHLGRNADKAIALAEKCMANFDTLNNAFQSYTPTGVGDGAALVLALKAWGIALPPTGSPPTPPSDPLWPEDVASTNAKAKGAP